MSIIETFNSMCAERQVQICIDQTDTELKVMIEGRQFKSIPKKSPRSYNQAVEIGMIEMGRIVGRPS